MVPLGKQLFHKLASVELILSEHGFVHKIKKSCLYIDRKILVRGKSSNDIKDFSELGRLLPYVNIQVQMFFWKGSFCW